MKEKKVFLLTLIPEAAPPLQWPAKDKKSGDNIQILYFWPRANPQKDG
jgi:hypothetical protein